MSELGPEAREILRNGREGDNPTPADRARIHASLMAAIAAGAATTAAANAANAASAGTELSLPASVGTAKPVVFSLFGGVFAKGVLVLVVGAAGVGGWMAWSDGHAKRPPSVHRIAETSIVSENAASSAFTNFDPAPLDGPIRPQVVLSEVVVAAKPFSPRTTESEPEVAEESADSIIAETQRLREAHAAMREKDPEKALALLSEPAAEDEGQKLREERAAARVLALCKLGRVNEAQAEASAFLVQNPRSPWADRVRKACSTSP